MRTYTIDAGQLDSILRIRNERKGHQTIDSALQAIADACGVEESSLTWAAYDDGVVRVYRSEDDMQEDVDGSNPLASLLK